MKGLIVEGMAVSRGDRGLFRDLSLTVAAGEAVALTGANGAGKTSLLRAIAGFLRPDAGTVTFEGIEAETARRRDLHLLGHLEGLKGARTARDELAFQCRWLGATEAGIAAAVEALNLEPLLDLPVRTLSAGQKRRLALARLAAAPRALWLLDEPLAPLDDRWRAAADALMRAHLDRGGLILAAVHDPLPAASRAVRLETPR